MQNEVRIRVRLDTSQARAELRVLVHEAESTSGRVGGRIRQAVGAGLGAMGMGAAFQMGMSAVRAPLQGSAGDILGESIGAYGAMADQLVFGSMGPEARAAAMAREEVRTAYGAVIGQQGSIPQSAVTFFNQRKDQILQEQMGRQKIDMDKRFRSVDAEKLASEALRAIDEGFRKLGDHLGQTLRGK